MGSSSDRALVPRDDPTVGSPESGVVSQPVTPGTAAAIGVTGMAVPPVQPWAGWPTEWATPYWSQQTTGHLENLADVAWMCLDKNSMIIGAMPPYLVGAAPSLDTAWMINPDPDRYTCWEEFARGLFWDYQGCGEAFIVATGYYRSGWPARFHLLPPWSVDVELDDKGRRRYHIGELDATDDLLHVRYQSRTTDAHGYGPLAAGAARLVQASLLQRYASNLMAAGGVPTTVLVHPSELTAQQSAELQTQWVNARINALGLPAVLSGGVDFRQLMLSPRDLALTDLAAMTETRVANLLGVPGYMVGLPQSSDSLVYNTAALTLDFHWRVTLRNLVRQVIGALSAWALPAGTVIELNRDEYVKPGPLERAQYYATMIAAGVMTTYEARTLERFETAAPSETLESGVLQ